jgi:hypothetical protein
MSQTIADLAAKMELGTLPVRKQGIKPNAWTEAENQILREGYPQGGSVAVMHLLHRRTRKGVNCQAAKLGLRNVNNVRIQDWTEAQLAGVRDHYTAKGARYVSDLIGRSVFAVRHKAADMGIPADKSLAGKVRHEQQRKPTPPKPRHGPKMVVMRKPEKKPAHGFTGEEIRTRNTKITIAPPFVDKRWASEHVPSVVDSEQCRAWALAAT